MNDKMMAKALDEMELDMVVGGGTYYMIRYCKRGDGRYDAEMLTFNGDSKQWQAFLSGKTIKESMNAHISTKYSKGIRADYINGFLDRYRKRGYVIRQVKSLGK